MPAATLERILRIQRLRDAALALPLLDAIERRSVLLAGNGHVRRDHGVPLYLGAYEREALVVGFEQMAEPEIDAARGNDKGEGNDLARVVGTTRAAEFRSAYDLVALTTIPLLKDHCAATGALSGTADRTPTGTAAGADGGAPAGISAGTPTGGGRGAAGTATVSPAAPTQTPSR